jgi:glutaconate CoA-transferase, subunit B
MTTVGERGQEAQQGLNPRPDEVMTISASRLLEDGKVMFAGIGQPLVAAALARRRHAPDLTVILEGGMVGIHLMPGELPDSTNEMRAAIGAEMLTTATDIFLMAQRGFFDYGFLGVAQIDKFGNVNTSLIGDPDRPSVRLPGPGGANDIITMCNETVIVTNHEPRRFVERVDWVTSPGYLSGGDSRRRAGLRHGGPSWVVTDLALLDFEEATRRMRLRRLQPGVTVDQVVSATGFDLVLPSHVEVMEPVTHAELRLLRQLTGDADLAETTGDGDGDPRVD